MIQHFQKRLSETPCDLALFFDSDSNITYFAGVRTERACLAIPKEGEAILFVVGFEADRHAQNSTTNVIKTDRKILEKAAEQFRAKNIGIVSSAVTYADAKNIQDIFGAQLYDVSEIITAQRAVKTDGEIARIKKACAITDELFGELIQTIGTLATERDCANFLKTRMMERGVEPSFAPIIATAANAAIPHHEPTDAKLNGFTVIDFGVVFKNYCSDMTRTVFAGTPTAKDKEHYERVLAVQEDSIASCIPGATLEEVHDAAKKKLGEAFIHRIGHSLGIDVHDTQPTPYAFQENCIVTMEPGIYFPGKFGIRIEDDVVITNKTPNALTQTPKTLLRFHSRR